MSKQLLRRVTASCALITAMIVATMPASATADPKGELNAAFNAGPGGGSSVFFHNETAAAVAAPAIPPPPDGRILPWAADQEFCENQPLGLWVFWLGTTDMLSALDNQFELDGVELTEKRTPIKPNLPRAEAGETEGKWMAEGVPVIGTLSVGTHSFTWTVFDDGVLSIEQTHEFEVVEC